MGDAGVAELVDAGLLKSPAPERVGSSPTTRTTAGPACDGEEVGEHALARQVGPGAGSGDRDLSDRARPQYESVGHAADARERVTGGNGLGLDAGGHGPRPVRA